MAKLQTNKVGALENISPVARYFRMNMTQIVTFVVLILLMIALSFMEDNFLTARNIINIFLQASVIGVLAVGMSFVIFSDGIDLSVGSVMALCCTVMGDLVVNKGLNPWLGIIIGLAIGSCCGAITGCLITKVKMPAFIVTMGAMLLWRGVALEFVDGQGLYGVPGVLKALGADYVGDPKTNDFAMPYAVIMLFILFTIAWFVLKKTQFGTHVYAIGDNEKASKLSGIKVDRIRIAIYAISGFMCALAAIVVTGRMNGSTPIVGQSYELEAIAGVAIGGASMSGGVGTIWGTLIGVIMVQVIRNGMNMVGLSPYYQQIIIGIIIIFAVGIDCFRRRKSN